jgi:capsular polysaccharide biosynthesis protein
VTISSWWRVLRVPLAVGLTTAVCVSAAIGLYASTRPAVYQARFTLVAAPAPKAATSVTDLGSVVDLVLPSLTELARSPDVLSRVTRKVGEGQDATQLAGQITVELVPASGVARVSVRDGSARRATSTASELAREIQSLHLLGAVGNFRAFNAQSRAREIAPDRPLGIGLGLAAGLIAGLLAGTVTALRRPRLVSRRQVAGTLGDAAVPVLRQVSLGALDSRTANLLTSIDAELIGVGRGASEALADMGWGPPLPQGSRSTAGDPTSASAQAPNGRVVLVGVLGMCTPEELSNAYGGVVAGGSRVVAVLMLDRVDATRSR